VGCRFFEPTGLIRARPFRVRQTPESQVSSWGFCSASEGFGFVSPLPAIHWRRRVSRMIISTGCGCRHRCRGSARSTGLRVAVGYRSAATFAFDAQIALALGTALRSLPGSTMTSPQARFMLARNRSGSDTFAVLRLSEDCHFLAVRVDSVRFVRSSSSFFEGRSQRVGLRPIVRKEPDVT